MLLKLRELLRVRREICAIHMKRHKILIGIAPCRIPKKIDVTKRGRALQKSCYGTAKRVSRSSSVDRTATVESNKMIDFQKAIINDATKMKGSAAKVMLIDAAASVSHLQNGSMLECYFELQLV